MTTSVQHPLTSGFGPASTAADVIGGIDLTGRVAIVTGGYSGIGLETVRVLRGAGAEIVVTARDLGRARAALQGIDGVEIAQMDLIDAASIDAFADGFLASGRPLHLLVNNAGIMATPLARDKRGYESQLAVNHLGHFQLTTRLWPALVAAGGARVVALSSRGHRFSPFVFDDPQFEHRAYEPFVAYGQSKTANSLFVVELDRRGQDEGVRAFAAHPGTILDTALIRHLDSESIRATGVIGEDGEPLRDPEQQLKTIPQGAATTVWCATSPQLAGHGGVYCENSDISPLVSSEDEAAWRKSSGMPGVLPYAVDSDAATRLWELSERLIAQ
jgi:NAD(P)-dependent dehydrogenase (short-subunit alcohol dehydrogenase family)